VTDGVAIETRRQLSRLIYDGLAGRTLATLFRQLAQGFADAGETLAYETFVAWLSASSFPANRKRQTLLGNAVGGACGEAIKKLPSPAFRGWRRKIMSETEAKKMTTHAQSRREYSRTRQFPTISHKGEDGRTHLRPVIECSACHTRESVVRQSTTHDTDLFEKKGWEVGKNHAHDLCPMCIKERDRAKVVKMEDHVKKNGEDMAKVADRLTEVRHVPAAMLEMSKEDGRIISRLIEDRWDEQGGCYKPGWSDAKLAEEVKRPVEWIKARRELDFGGTGEDPGIVDFLKAQVALSSELAGLRSEMDLLAGSVSELSSAHQKVQRQLEKYRDGHNALAGKAQRLQEVASKLTPPFPDRKAG